jgi:serralysin
MCQLCGDALHASGIGGVVGDPVTSGALPPDFGLQQIIQQLQTQWGGDAEGDYREWTGATLTYAFPTTAPTNFAPYAGTPPEAAGLMSLSATMAGTARLAFELWDDLIAPSLVEAVGDAAADITFNYSSTTSGGGTYASSLYYTGAPDELVASQIWLNSGWSTHNQDADLVFGGYGVTTYLHEIGHSLGLSHAGTYDAGGGTPITFAGSAEYSQDNRQFTVMSYFGGYDTAANAWALDGTRADWKFASTPMLHDVAAIQAKYGADMTTRTGDTVYGFNSTAGKAVFDFTLNDAPVLTIWDAAGNDTLDLSGYRLNQRIDLTEGSYSDIGGMIGNVAIAYGALIENALGGSGSDAIGGNAAANNLMGRAGADTLSGAAGDDTLDGGSSNDTLWGGSGNDLLIGGAHKDLLNGGEGDDELFGGSGDDTLAGDAGVDRLFGGDGNDRIDGGAGDDRLEGGSGDDIFTADAGNDEIIGGAGYDTLDFSAHSGGANVNLQAHTASAAGSGTDTVWGIEAVKGTAFDDVIIGDKTGNTFWGLDGNDTFRGLEGADIFKGGGGSDTYTWALKDVYQAGIHQGVDLVRDFSVGIDVLNFDRLRDDGVTGVHLQERAGGTMISIDVAGAGTLDLVLLEGRFGVDASALGLPDGLLVG